MIHLKEVSKAFNRGRENEFWALRDVSLSVEAGKVTVFRGPSGSGKTTLLTMVGCLSRPTSGRVRLKDKDISALPERFLTEIRRHTFGFVFQQFNLIRGLNAIDNVMIPAYPMGRNRGELAEKAHILLQKLKLGHKAGSRVEWLSGGEAQRVAIARALINDPDVVIADEPTANLDTALSLEFLEIVESLKTDGKTVLMTSHDAIVCDASVVDATIAMRDGRLVEEV